jgi:hypothetical protein
MVVANVKQKDKVSGRDRRDEECAEFCSGKRRKKGPRVFILWCLLAVCKWLGLMMKGKSHPPLGHHSRLW